MRDERKNEGKVDSTDERMKQIKKRREEREEKR